MSAAMAGRYAAVWLAYAQDRKLEDPRYTVAAFRRDINRARRVEGLARPGREGDGADDDADQQVRWDCPWITPYCTRSGRPLPVAQCSVCTTGRCAATNQSAEREETSV
jgi:hypothetical protein